jgi:hypothetical protein
MKLDSYMSEMLVLARIQVALGFLTLAAVVMGILAILILFFNRRDSHAQ